MTWRQTVTAHFTHWNSILVALKRRLLIDHCYANIWWGVICGRASFFHFVTTHRPTMRPTQHHLLTHSAKVKNV